MDSLTHVALGMVSGEALLGRRAGKRAWLYGALAQSFPDIDFVAAFWSTPAENLLAHRGLTHSLLGALVMATVFSGVATRWHPVAGLRWPHWFGFFGLQLLLHLGLDSLNAYGVGLLEPFHDHRFSAHVLYVADPLFLLPVLVGSVALVFMRVEAQRHRLAMVMLALSGAYLVYAAINKVQITRQVAQALEAQHLDSRPYFTTPAPFNTWLWMVTVRDSAGVRVGYRSVLDRTRPLALTYFPQNDSLLHRAKDQSSVALLKTFAMGWYTVEQQGDTVLFNIPRFGQVTGWHDAHMPFVFRYYLDQTDINRLVMQRGRFENWNAETVASFRRRMRGK